MLLLPSLNEMFDVAETERLARRIHSPRLIFFMLAISALASAVFVGYAVAGGARRNGMYMIGSAATVAVAMYVSSSSNIHASAFFAPMLSITRWSSCEQR
jgi:hypothetical protein